VDKLDEIFGTQKIISAYYDVVITRAALTLLTVYFLIDLSYLFQFLVCESLLFLLGVGELEESDELEYCFVVSSQFTLD